MVKIGTSLEGENRLQEKIYFDVKRSGYSGSSTHDQAKEMPVMLPNMLSPQTVSSVTSFGVC